MSTPAAPTRQALRHLRRMCDICASPTRQLSTRCEKPMLPAPSRAFRPTAPRTSTASRPLSTIAPRGQQQPHGQRHQSRSASSSSASPSTTTLSSDGDRASANANANALPDPTTYYTLFPSTLPSGPPPRSPFAIPLPTLRREFLQLQSRHHPDKYVSTPAHRQALALSSLLNAAYKTLSDPLLRARYLLHLSYGVDITSEDNSEHAGVTGPETLMEVMEAQEAMEEAAHPGEIEALRELNDRRIRGTEEAMATAFEEGDVEGAKRETVRLNYWRNIKQGLDEWEPGKEVRLIH